MPRGRRPLPWVYTLHFLVWDHGTPSDYYNPGSALSKPSAGNCLPGYPSPGESVAQCRRWLEEIKQQMTVRCKEPAVSWKLFGSQWRPRRGPQGPGLPEPLGSRPRLIRNCSLSSLSSRFGWDSNYAFLWGVSKHADCFSTGHSFLNLQWKLCGEGARVRDFRSGAKLLNSGRGRSWLKLWIRVSRDWFRYKAVPTAWHRWQGQILAVH